MLRLVARLAGALALWLGLSGLAAAQCVGQNLVDQYRAEDPAGVAAAFERARTIPNGQGRLWQVTRDGLAPSYLYGTFHTGEATEYVSDRAWQALDGARTAIFEMDLDELAALEARTQTDPGFIFDASAPPLSTRVSPEVLREIRTALTQRGVPGSMGEQMRPWMLFALLSFPVCHFQAQIAGDKPLDQIMNERALENGTRVLGLETYQEALSAFGKMPADEFLTMMTSQNLMFDIETDIFVTNLQLYGAGEISAILEMAIYIAERKDPETDHRGLTNLFLEELLDARNLRWMPVVLREVAAGGAFIGVGALHLPGETGLIELLRGEGYTVTRLN